MLNRYTHHTTLLNDIRDVFFKVTSKPFKNDSPLLVDGIVMFHLHVNVNQ